MVTTWIRVVPRNRRERRAVRAAQYSKAQWYVADTMRRLSIRLVTDLAIVQS